MAKRKQGWELGEGPYAGNKGNKDPIRAGDPGDLPVGVGVRQLDIDMIHEHSKIDPGTGAGGASRRLPRRM